MRDRRRSCCYYNRCSNLMGPHTYLSHRRIIKDLASSQQVGGRSHILGALISQLITDRFRRRRRRRRRNNRFGPACFSTPGNGHFRTGRRRFCSCFVFVYPVPRISESYASRCQLGQQLFSPKRLGLSLPIIRALASLFFLGPEYQKRSKTF